VISKPVWKSSRICVFPIFPFFLFSKEKMAAGPHLFYDVTMITYVFICVIDFAFVVLYFIILLWVSFAWGYCANAQR